MAKERKTTRRATWAPADVEKWFYEEYDSPDGDYSTEAFLVAKSAWKVAYEKGYSKGFGDGYDEGYNNAEVAHCIDTG